MEGPQPAPTIADLHVAPVQTAVMTSTAFPPATSVIEVVPSRPMLDQSPNLIAEVLPPEGFTLVNLDLESLQLDQACPQQLEEEGTEEVDELDDGVNLVVKGSWWWCKDCNIKQKFGAGESIEDHLRTKHGISNKTEDHEFLKSSDVQQCRQASKDSSSSDVISSVYTIPSNSVEGQDIETFIVIDGTTTLQVITKPAEENTVFMTPLDDKPVVSPPQNLSKVLSGSGSSTSDVSGNSSSAVKTLTPIKPIPVLPALQWTDTQPSSIVSALLSQHGEVPGKESTSPNTDNILETNSSDPVSETPQWCNEDARAKSPLVKPADDLDGSGSQSELSKTSTQHFHSQLRKTSTQPSSGSHSQPRKTSTQHSSGSHSRPRKTSTQHSSGNHSRPRKTSTQAAVDGRHDIGQKKPLQLNSESGGMVTRRKVCQKTDEKTSLKNCSVHLTRLSSEEVHQGKKKPLRKLPKSKLESACAQTAKHRKSTNKSTVSKPQTALKKSAKKNASLAQNLKGINPQKKGAFPANPQPDMNKEKKLMFSSMRSRTSSGRKIRKPARFITGSENEEDNDSLPNHQAQEEEKEEEEKEDKKKKKKKESTFPSATSTAKSPQQNNLPKAKKSPKKRKLLSVISDHEPENHVPDGVNKAKKVREENYSCEDCGRKFKSKNKLEKHSKLYADQTMERCTVCDVTLHNADLLNVHMYHMHLTKQSTSCHTCGNVLGSKRNLLSHLLTHSHMEGQTVANLIRDSCAVHECTVCDEPIIVGEGRVEKHYLIHEKPNACECQKCGQSFRHKKELYNHLRSHGDHNNAVQASSDQSQEKGVATTNSQDNQTATLESKTFSEQLDASVVGLHPDDRVIAESVKQIMKFEEGTSQGSENPVTVTFLTPDTKEAERGDQQGPHTVKPVIFCELCKKKFTTKKLLYQHLKIHGSQVSELTDNEEGPAALSEPEPAAQPVDLTAGVPFGIPCSLVKVECSETEPDNFLRKSFTTTAEGLVIPGQMHFSCALCEREFESEIKARRHVNRFSQQRTILQCHLCSSRFHNLDLFNVHYAYIHQAAGTASCLTCKMDFNNKGDFLTHLGNNPLSHPLSHKTGYSTFVQDACGTVTCSVCQKSMWNYPMNIANHTRKHRSLSCPICQQEMPYKYALFVHLQVHANAKHAGVVGKLSETDRQQNEQMEKLHSIVCEVESGAFVESNEKFCCSFCDGEVLRTRKNIHQHLDLHARKLLHRTREGQYFCPDCGESIAVSDHSMATHLGSHGHAEVVFVCIFCSQTFSAFDAFRDHELKKHWLNVYFEKNMCEVCGKEFVSRQQFQKHVKLHNEKQGLFSCSHCKQTFRFESKLQKHMAKHKKGSYACQFCGKLYMTKISLDRHEQVVHIGIKDFKHKCQLCDAQFINATHLRDHVTNKHTSGASYRCAQCGMGFQYLSTFARHKRVVHGGDTPYVCQECGEKFPQKKLLQRHMIRHTGINPFQCPACPKSFSLERTMKEHYDFCHQGIHKFVCPYCSSKFPRSRSLKRHMETCRMSGPPQAQTLPVYAAKVPIQIHAAVKPQNAGLVVIQQV